MPDALMSNKPVKMQRAVLPILQMGNSSQKGQAISSRSPSHVESTSPHFASSLVTFNHLTLLFDILNSAVIKMDNQQGSTV